VALTITSAVLHLTAEYVAVATDARQAPAAGANGATQSGISWIALSSWFAPTYPVLNTKTTFTVDLQATLGDPLLHFTDETWYMVLDIFQGVLTPTQSCDVRIYDAYINATRSDGAVATLRPTVAEIVGNTTNVLQGVPPAPNTAYNYVSNPANAIDGDLTTFAIIHRNPVAGPMTDYPNLLLRGFTGAYFPTVPAWLIINEPSLGFTDRSGYLHESFPATFTNTRGERGSANITLHVAAGDSYEPTTGTQTFLWEHTAAGWTQVFAGTIDTVQLTYDAEGGDRNYALACVSFEQCFDTLFVGPKVYASGTPCGDVVADILSTDCSGVPVGAGTIDAGENLTSDLIVVNLRPSEVFDQVADLSGFIWYVDPATLTLNFHLPSSTAAPFTLVASDALFGSIEWDQTRQDYRNQHVVQISPDAFAHSAELFQGTGTDLFFTLRNVPDEITNAWVTHNTQNTATATFTGQPADGDTVTIGYPTVGSTYDWVALVVYASGQIIIDHAGHVQRCTTGGTSGSSYPAFTEVLGSVTVDGTVIWTDQGASGSGEFADLIYTFKTSIDNREFGQVLIGASATETAQHLADAINAVDATKGISYSLPTWESSLVNADAVVGSTFVIRNKNAGQGYVAALSESAANFAWSAATTSGGITTFDTYELSIANEGTSNTANLYWTKGSPTVKFVSTPKGGPNCPISSAWYLQVEYKRLGFDCIAVEDTAAVLLRASVESGTGKYQIKTDDTNQTSAPGGLAYAQALLAGYGTLPNSFKFVTDVAGLLPGQLLAITLSGAPDGSAALIDGDWLVQEVQGDLIPGVDYLRATGGHFRYTVTVISTTFIGTDIKLWQKMAGGSASGGGGASGSGGSLAGIAADVQNGVIGLTVDGGGAAPATGHKGYIQVPYTGTIVGWAVVADQSGSLTLEIDKHASAVPPAAPTRPNTSSDKISASAPVSLSSAASASVGTSGVSTWTIAVNQWDVFGFNLTAATTVQRFTVTLFIQRS
jgi:hypothetical protein